LPELGHPHELGRHRLDHRRVPKERDGFQPPLDAVDGAARVCDPIVSGFLTGNHVSGQFLKDCAQVAW
jgi:hypothetical protein